MAKQRTDEPRRLASTANGLAQPKDKNQYGYISEHQTFGHTNQKAANVTEDLAATMLASTVGIDHADNIDRRHGAGLYQGGNACADPWRDKAIVSDLTNQNS